MNVLELRDVTIHAGAGALRGVGLSVAPGQRVALVSTEQELVTRLVRVCAGLDAPASGQVRLWGTDMGASPRGEVLRARHRLGYVLAEAGVFANMSFFDNLALILRYLTEDPEDAIEGRVHAHLATWDLSELAQVRASTAVPALQKRLAYARATVHEPELLLSEDPSALLDPSGRRLVVAAHRRHGAAGGTSLVADDDLSFVGAWANRVVVFRDATVAYDGPMDGLPPRLRAELDDGGQP